MSRLLSNYLQVPITVKTTFYINKLFILSFGTILNTQLYPSVKNIIKLTFAYQLRLLSVIINFVFYAYCVIIISVPCYYYKLRVLNIAFIHNYDIILLEHKILIHARPVQNLFLYNAYNFPKIRTT